MSHSSSEEGEALPSVDDRRFPHWPERATGTVGIAITVLPGPSSPFAYLFPPFRGAIPVPCRLVFIKFLASYLRISAPYFRHLESAAPRAFVNEPESCRTYFHSVPFRDRCRGGRCQ